MAQLPHPAIRQAQVKLQAVHCYTPVFDSCAEAKRIREHLFAELHALACCKDGPYQIGDTKFEQVSMVREAIWREIKCTYEICQMEEECPAAAGAQFARRPAPRICKDDATHIGYSRRRRTGRRF